MVDNIQKKMDDSRDVSPLANDLTYGEKKHRQIFGVAINFATNLLASAGFTYWVNHSEKPVNLFGHQFNRPAEVQRSIAKWIEAKPFMSVFRESAARFEAAKVMAGVLTLTAAGHIIMIPSVWLGAKIKAPMVEWFNRRHYGDEAMEDPSLKARHLAIRMEDRPTLFGAVTGRFGTILATQLTGYTVGSHRNLVRWAGSKLGVEAMEGFKGIDYMTEFAGDKFGGILSEALPKQTARLNESIAKHRYGWSMNQIEKAQKEGIDLTDAAYGTLPNNAGTSGFNEHYGKYVVSDIMYTLVTALSINPAINFFKKYIPGMTYKPAVKQEVPDYLKDDIATIRVRPNPLVSMDAATPTIAAAELAPAEANPSPRIDLSHTAHLSTVGSASQKHEVGA